MSETPNSDMYHTVPRAVVVVELEKQLATVTAERDALLRRIDRALRGIESGSLQRTKIALTEIEHGEAAIDAAKRGGA